MKKIDIEEYNYILPDERIAKYPLEKRDESKLLVFKNGVIEKSTFKNIDKYLPENNLMFVNNTKVIYARLSFRKATGSKIEIFCLNPHTPQEYNMAFDAKGKSKWICIVGNLKKWKQGELIQTFEYEGRQYFIKAKYIDKIEQNHLIEFEWDNKFTFSEILMKLGEIPIPPYLNRKSEEKDKDTYQTVYSKHKGSVAAPTAGLHFTEEVFEKLKAKNITKAELTLHVGAGTFKPVKTDDVREHEMHTEYFFINREGIEKLIINLGNITAVGTTSLRSLESIYWIGVKLYNNLPDFNYVKQWETYDYETIPAEIALKTILSYMDNQNNDILEAMTQIIIVPGYDFKIVNQIITNFHQPKSTLLLLIAAFIGKSWKDIYKYALENDFRFLSYGDSSVLFKMKH